MDNSPQRISAGILKNEKFSCLFDVQYSLRKCRRDIKEDVMPFSVAWAKSFLENVMYQAKLYRYHHFFKRKIIVKHLESPRPLKLNENTALFHKKASIQVTQL